MIASFFFFVGSAISAFAMWYFHAAPTESIAILLVSSFVGMIVAVNVKDLLCHFIAYLCTLGGSMRVLALIVIFALGLLHIIPGNFFAGICLLWTFASFAFPWSSLKRKARDPEIIAPPIGLGGYVADSEVERKGGQSNSSLIALMKLIDAELEHNPTPVYTTREVADTLIAMANAKVSLFSDEKTDESYDEPVASYPEMTSPER